MIRHYTAARQLYETPREAARQLYERSLKRSPWQLFRAVRELLRVAYVTKRTVSYDNVFVFVLYDDGSYGVATHSASPAEPEFAGVPFSEVCFAILTEYDDDKDFWQEKSGLTSLQKGRIQFTDLSEPDPVLELVEVQDSSGFLIGVMGLGAAGTLAKSKSKKLQKWSHEKRAVYRVM